MTIKEAALRLMAPGAPSKLRLQAPFRDSDSFAAFMRIVSGCPVVHDTGTATTYRLNGVERCTWTYGDLEDEPAVAPTEDQPTADAKEPAVPVKRRALRVVSPAELRKLPPVEWRIEGLLPKSGIAVLYGPSGVGKSFVALSMALAVARGVSWHDLATTRCGALYLAAEGFSGFRGRLAAYAVHHGCDLDTEPFGIVPEAIDLMESEDPQRVIDAALARPEPVGLILIDTLNRSMSGDENTAADMTKVIAAAAKISSKTDALVLIITHTGKDEDRGARGHSSLRAAADAEYYISGRGEIKTLQVTKMRDGSDQVRLGFRLKAVEICDDADAGVTMVVPVVVPAALDAPNAGSAGRKPGSWDRIILDAYEAAVARFESVDAPGVPTDVVLEYLPERYREAKGADLPVRWRDSARRSLAELVKTGVLCLDDGHVTRPFPQPQPPHTHHTS